MAEQEYDLMHKDDVVASLQLDDLSGAIKMTLTVWFHRLIIQLLFAPQRTPAEHPRPAYSS